jgi:hypothetical protein
MSAIPTRRRNAKPSLLSRLPMRYFKERTLVGRPG